MKYNIEKYSDIVEESDIILPSLYKGNEMVSQDNSILSQSDTLLIEGEAV